LFALFFSRSSRAFCFNFAFAADFSCLIFSRALSSSFLISSDEGVSATFSESFSDFFSAAPFEIPSKVP